LSRYEVERVESEKKRQTIFFCQGSLCILLYSYIYTHTHTRIWFENVFYCSLNKFASNKRHVLFIFCSLIEIFNSGKRWLCIIQHHVFPSVSYICCCRYSLDGQIFATERAYEPNWCQR